VKLSASEIARLQHVAGEGTDWRRDLQDGFRQVVFERAQQYLAEGDFGTPPYRDEPQPISPVAEFASLVDKFGFLRVQAPDLAEYLQLFPRLEGPDVVDSFLYWSTETLGAKPITSVTHVAVTRGDAPGMPEVLVASKQVYATHYKNASLSVTAITGSEASGRYLVYVHRSYVDVLHGMFGGLVRRAIERRIREDAPGALENLRRRLEARDPP
jgi:hypothetical protein